MGAILELVARRVELPALADAFERVLAAVVELDPCAGNQVPDRARDEHLPGPGKLGHPCADMHGDARDVAVPRRHLAGVEPGTDLEPDERDGVPDPQAHLIARAGPSKVAR